MLKIKKISLPRWGPTFVFKTGHVSWAVVAHTFDPSPLHLVLQGPVCVPPSGSRSCTDTPKFMYSEPHSVT